MVPTTNARAVASKTVSRRLDEREAELYQSWVADRRRLEAVVTEMEKVSVTTDEVPLPQAAPGRSRRARR
jgi:hypothetical protein